jgi:hypothetical protein
MLLLMLGAGWAVGCMKTDDEVAVACAEAWPQSRPRASTSMYANLILHQGMTF